MIHRSETFYAVDARRPPPEGTPRAYLPTFYWGPPGRVIAVPTGVSRRKPVVAFVNHGRWTVECPTAGCGGAQVAAFSDRRFLCHVCGNAEVDGKWIRVDWPVEVDEIERELSVRPEPSSRNWVPGEPVEWLRAENDRHGVSR